jgi:hypothetical protein
VNLMQPLDAAKIPAVHDPALNHIDDKHGIAGGFRLDACRWTSPSCSWRRATQSGDIRGLYSLTISKADCIFAFVITERIDDAHPESEAASNVTQRVVRSPPGSPRRPG